ATAGLTPRQLYLTGRDEYKRGDWIAARRNLVAAIDSGYKPHLFEDSPETLLRRMDKKEQADAAKAARQAQRPTAVAQVPPAPAPTVTEVPPAPAPAPAPAPVIPPAPAPTPTPVAVAPESPGPAPVPGTPEQQLAQTAEMQGVRGATNAAEARRLVDQART